MKKYSLADYILTPQTTISSPPGEWDVSSIAVEGQLLYILWVNVEPIDVVLPTAFNVYKKMLASLLCREVKRVKSMTWADPSAALDYLKECLLTLVDHAQMDDERDSATERHRHMVKMLIKHTYVTYEGREIQLSTIANVLLDIWDDVFPGLTRPEDLLGSIPCTTSCTDLVARLSPWLFNDPSS